MNRYEIQLRISHLQIMRWKMLIQGNSYAVSQLNEMIAEHMRDLEGI